jgi:F-type H+-transporting ATPase subunit b
MEFLAQSTTSTAPNPLVPSLPELISGLIAFFIVFGVLGKVLIPRLQKTLAERTDQIEGGIERAKEAQAQANRTLEEYRAQLADARHEAARLREEAREQGAQIKAELRAEGEAEKRQLVESARAQIEADRQQALASLRAEVGTLSIDLASRVVGESLQDEARQRRTVDRFLADLEAHPGTAEAEAAR